MLSSDCSINETTDDDIKKLKLNFFKMTFAVKTSFWFIALINALLFSSFFAQNYLQMIWHVQLYDIKCSCMNVRKWIEKRKKSSMHFVASFLWGFEFVLQRGGKTDSTSTLNSILLVSFVALYASIIPSCAGGHALNILMSIWCVYRMCKYFLSSSGD